MYKIARFYHKVNNLTKIFNEFQDPNCAQHTVPQKAIVVVKIIILSCSYFPATVQKKKEKIDVNINWHKWPVLELLLLPDRVCIGKKAKSCHPFSTFVFSRKVIYGC